MGRMTVTLEEDLLLEAQRLIGARTRRETIRRALEEAIRSRKRDRALARAGKIDLELDQELLEKLRGEG
jgi:Arc/MetJ family transcription regulator